MGLGPPIPRGAQGQDVHDCADSGRGVPATTTRPIGREEGRGEAAAADAGLAVPAAVAAEAAAVSGGATAAAAAVAAAAPAAAPAAATSLELGRVGASGDPWTMRAFGHYFRA